MRQKPHLHSVRMGQCVLVCSVYQMFIPLGLTQRCYKDAKNREKCLISLVGRM